MKREGKVDTQNVKQWISNETMENFENLRRFEQNEKNEI